nr:dTDP-4-amino-4,6-dideoxygalactose transaminase [Butyrivibrio sp. LB2008]
MSEKKIIPFNKPVVIGTERKYIDQVLEKQKLCGDGAFTKKCNEWLEKNIHCGKGLLTTSCTHATEMAVLLSNISEGDEVIMPSYTFVSTADAVVLRGAVPVFVDIRPDTMNIDEKLIEEAITDKTKAIIPVHYAGVSCEMDRIIEIADRYNLSVIEDAAQAIGSLYKGKYCGTLGNYGCLSFHETKNINMGEGGALLIRDSDNFERAEIIREKGTNRSKFYRGEIDKYTWVDAGSSYLPSELNAAFLFGQLERYEEIQISRMNAWNNYYGLLKVLEDKGDIELPFIPRECVHNAHMFYIKVKDIEQRTKLVNYLKQYDINAVFHYIPLHSAPAGVKYGRFNGEDKYTTKESERLLRLPLYYGICCDDVERVAEKIKEYFKI